MRRSGSLRNPRADDGIRTWDIELTSSGLVLTQENNWNISTDFAEVWDTVEGDGDGTLTAAELDAEICPDDENDDDDGAELAFNFPQDDMMSINGETLSMDISSMTCTVSSTEHASGMHATIIFSMTYTGAYTADAMGELVWDIEARDDGDSDVYWTREDMCVWNDNETEWDCFYWDHEDDEYHESTWWYYCEFIGASDATKSTDGSARMTSADPMHGRVPPTTRTSMERYLRRACRSSRRPTPSAATRITNSNSPSSGGIPRPWHSRSAMARVR